LRRAAALMLVFMPLMLSTLAAFWVVQLVFGHVHPLTVALGMVLLGVSVDYPIHLLLHKSPRQAWLGVRLAIVTTLVGYLSWFALTSEGFSQLAWFSVSGLVFMLVILAWMRRLGAGAVGLSAPSSLSQPLPSGLALLLLLPFLAWGVKPLYWQDDLASMSPISPQALAQDGQLRQLFGQPQVDQIVLVDAANEAALLQKLDALEPSLAALAAQGVLAQSLSLADWLPSAARQSARQQMLPDQAALMAAVSELALPFRAEHWQPFFDAVAQTANLPVLDVRGFSAQALDWQQAFLPYLVRVDEQQAVARIWLFDVRDSAALAQWARDEGVELVQQRAFIEAQIAELRQRVSQILFLMLVLFVLGLALSYRRLRPVLSVAGSVILTALVTLSSLHALLPALSVFHLVALVLVLAMSVDYAVFAEQVKRQTGDLVSVNTALITSLLTFSLLLLAPIPLLVAMGQTLVIGVLSAYLSARLLHRV
jgi:predicted exporter